MAEFSQQKTGTSKSKEADISNSSFALINQKSSENPILAQQKILGNQEVQHLLNSGVIQPKLKISSPKDKYEQEADRIAEKIISMPETSAHENNTLLKITPKTKELPNGETKVPQQFENDINSLKGKSQPLPESIRAFFKPHFGNLSHVRIHTNNTAAKISDTIGARAFTLGHEIGLARGQYALGGNVNRSLLAHELTHVMQQRSISSEPLKLIQRKPEEESRQLQTPMAMEFAQREREFLGEVTPLLSPVAKAHILRANFDVGFISGLLEGLKRTVEVKDLKEFAKGFEYVVNIYDFYTGIPIGILVGITSSIKDNLVGIYELGELVYKAIEKIPFEYKVALVINPLLAIPYIQARETYKFLTSPEDQENVKRITNLILDAVAEFETYIREDPNALIKEGESLGLLLGEHAGEYFENMVLLEESYYDKAIAVGNLLGYVAFEIALMTLAPEVILAKGAITGARAVAKAAKGTRFVERILGIIDKCPGLRKLIDAFKKLAQSTPPKSTGKLQPTVSTEGEAVFKELTEELKLPPREKPLKLSKAEPETERIAGPPKKRGRFKGKYKETRVSVGPGGLRGRVKMQINYPGKAKLEWLRKTDFPPKRGAWMKKMANDQRVIDFFGPNSDAIKMMKKGEVPPGYQVHHNHPLAAGGENIESNFTLVPHEIHTRVTSEFEAARKAGAAEFEFPVFDEFVPGILIRSD